MAEQIPIIRHAEKVSGRFGPKGDPFFLATFSDGSRKMVKGLSPFEGPEFIAQFEAAGYTTEEATKAFDAVVAEEVKTP
jgi:hypothetical protein